MSATLNLCRGAVLFAALTVLGGLMPTDAKPENTVCQYSPRCLVRVAEVRAKPGKANELRSATLPLIALVRSDPKNLVYFFQEDRESPGHLTFYEVWANQADFDAHNYMSYVKGWFVYLPFADQERSFLNSRKVA